MRRRLLVLFLFAALTMPAVDGFAADVAQLESESLELVNSERSAAGLPTLANDPEGVEVARRHSARMSDAGSLSHNSNLPNEIQGWLKLGENVGRGPSVRDIHNAFMASEDHRHNILDGAFESLGVGIVVTNGQVWLTQVFILRERPAEPAPAPAEEPAPAPRRTRVAGVKLVKEAAAPAPPQPPTDVQGATFVEHQPQTAMMLDTEATDQTVTLALGGLDLPAQRGEAPVMVAALLLVLVVGSHMLRVSLRR